MLGKLFTALISPLGTALVLGLVALCLAVLARRAWARRFAGLLGALALGWLWGWSTPLASDALRGWIEDQAGPRTVEEVPQAAAMVVLGGGVSGARVPRRPYPDLGAAADRLWYAARLFHAGKAGRVILSGGTVRTGDGSEAEAMREFLLDLGVQDSAVLLESASDNTATNASQTAAMLAAQGVDEIILVTSALHMPRARALFERAGLKVIPAPTDFEVIDMPFDALRLTPDVDALQGSARAIKEVVGRWVGR